MFGAAARRAARATVLRPTLVYGAGRDQTLTRIAAFARRWHCCVLPADATGLRQPVHVDDLASAALAACDAPDAAGRSYALPGGETLPYREMVARVLRALPSRPALIEVPAPLFEAVLHAARALGRGQGVGDAMVARLRDDLVFDAGAGAAGLRLRAARVRTDGGDVRAGVIRAAQYDQPSFRYSFASTQAGPISR